MKKRNLLDITADIMAEIEKSNASKRSEGYILEALVANETPINLEYSTIEVLHNIQGDFMDNIRRLITEIEGLNLKEAN